MTTVRVPRDLREPEPAGVHLRLVRSRHRRAFGATATRRSRLLAAGAAGLVGAVLFGLVAAHVVLTQGQLELDRLTARTTTEQARFERLRLEAAQLESPERVVAQAQERLGMVPAPDVTYLSPKGATTARRAHPGRPSGEGREGGDGGRTWAAVKAQLVRR